jgi:hypothetical protein
MDKGEVVFISSAQSGIDSYPPLRVNVFPSIQNISTADRLIRVVLVATAAIVLIFLYKRRQAALTSKNGIPFPPRPPARRFRDNVLPSVMEDRPPALHPNRFNSFAPQHRTHPRRLGCGVRPDQGSTRQ